MNPREIERATEEMIADWHRRGGLQGTGQTIPGRLGLSDEEYALYLDRGVLPAREGPPFHAIDDLDDDDLPRMTWQSTVATVLLTALLLGAVVGLCIYFGGSVR